ncbi:hypothetical protein [Streptomyces sp. NPDC059009]|uniref:hypothetical protein n=1 Tax=Streptomyces sp. NPDC059009 TaxID=3346694 RepID=UPI00369F43C4
MAETRVTTAAEGHPQTAEDHYLSPLWAGAALAAAGTAGVVLGPLGFPPARRDHPNNS